MGTSQGLGFGFTVMIRDTNAMRAAEGSSYVDVLATSAGILWLIKDPMSGCDCMCEVEGCQAVDDPQFSQPCILHDRHYGHHFCVNHEALPHPATVRRSVSQ
jgi:hypothetical protein